METEAASSSHSPEVRGNAASSQEILVEKPQITLFVGPEGSGKSTQGRMFSEKFGIPFIECGQAFRDLRELNDISPTELSEKASKLQGYADWNLFKDVLKWRFETKIVKGEKIEENYDHGFVIDGAPRTLEQYEKFQELVSELGLDFPICMVYLHVPRKTSVARLKEREIREDTASDEVRLDLHYQDLDKKIKLAKKNGWEFHTVVTRVGQTKTKNLVQREILEKLNKLNKDWRKFVSLDNELSFEEIILDIANASNSTEKLRRVNDYMDNTKTTLSETSDTSSWFVGVRELQKYLQYTYEMLVADSLLKSQ